jgi:hypothetical protein
MNNTREYDSYGCVSMKLSVLMDNALMAYYPHVRMVHWFGSIFNTVQIRATIPKATEVGSVFLLERQCG